jgi:hypothetical protein
MPISQDLRAARNMDFAPTLNTYYFGDPLPLDGAAVKLEVRLYPGAAGAPVASDEAVDFADALVGQAVDPTDGVLKDQRCLTLNPSIAIATLAAMPGLNTPEAGDDQTFSYEIMLIYSDALRDQLWVGNFILEPGVVA